MTETSLLQIEVEVDGVKAFRGGKVGLVPNRLSTEARNAAFEGRLELTRGKKLVEVDGRVVVVSEKDISEDVVAASEKLVRVEVLDFDKDGNED